MIETHAILRSIVFEYNKDKCIKRIIGVNFNEAVTSLQALLDVNIDRIYEDIVSITINEFNKGSVDYTYIKVLNVPLEEYIQILFTWINRIVLLRKSIIEDKNNVDLKTIENVQVYAELLYSSTIFRLILSHTNVTIKHHLRIEYYVDKVSAHLRSLNVILLCLQEKPLEFGEMYKNIEWYFIEPIQSTIELKKA
ncbi:unnamed protein product, partial [Rotaria sp. Silwood1]